MQPYIAISKLFFFIEYMHIYSKHDEGEWTGLK